jgi:UDP-glucose 4-epimerase
LTTDHILSPKKENLFEHVVYHKRRAHGTEKAYNAMGAKPMITPIWLARLVSFIRWNYFGSPTHPSWVQAALVDFSASNAKLKATGWMPHYNNTKAIHTALQEEL